MRFIEDAFPLLVVLHAPRFDEAEMRAMCEGYERYFRRNEPYAVLTVSPGEFVRIGAGERKLITDWLNDPRVREFSIRLCMGASTVVPSAVARGAMTAILWFWKPPWHLECVSTVEEGVDYCVQRLVDQKVAMPRPKEVVGAAVVDTLRKIGGFEPSLRGALAKPR